MALAGRDMALVRTERRAVRVDQDVVAVRQVVREWAVAVGFSLVDQTKLVTAASELARNTMIHGGGGEMRLQALNDGPRRGVKVMFIDTGPGIADIELAMKDGYTTKGGLGLGLSGSKRLVNEFEIDSSPGKGTTVCIVRWK